MTQKASKYSQLLQASDKDKAASQVEHQVAQAKASVASQKASIEGQISKEKQRVEVIKGSFPLDVQAVIHAANAVKELEGFLKAVEEIETELF